MSDSNDNPDHQVEKPSFDATIEALIASAKSANLYNKIVAYGLSDLPMSDLPRLKPVWDSLSMEFRKSLLEQLTENSEANFELDYRTLGWLALKDPDPQVREAALGILWEDESLALMSQLIEMAQWDDALEVRAAAVSELGRFILLGELGDLPETETSRAQDAAIALYTNLDEDLEVRGRALEAIANCGHTIVADSILEAYESGEPLMQVSAIFAMGRTCDERWEAMILREMDSDRAEMRFEAARAAGEIRIELAVPQLARLIRDNDKEIKEVAIWSLGEIGGSRAMSILHELAEDAEDAGNNALLEIIEDAIGSASLVSGDLYGLDDDDYDDDDF